MTENNPAEFPSPSDADTAAHAPETSTAQTPPLRETEADAAPAAPLPDDLLEILVCPLTRSQLRQDGDWLVATSPINAGLSYPIRNGIPVLLVDEATLPDGIASLDEYKTKYADAIPC